ncbi:MAG: hypothetical protein JWM93_969 [Frankiales bacterium]|nr:hypothetical protein [Frankiales bacterium]
MKRNGSRIALTPWGVALTVSAAVAAASAIATFAPSLTQGHATLPGTIMLVTPVAVVGPATVPVVPARPRDRVSTPTGSRTPAIATPPTGGAVAPGATVTAPAAHQSPGVSGDDSAPTHATGPSDEPLPTPGDDDATSTPSPAPKPTPTPTPATVDPAPVTVVTPDRPVVTRGDDDAEGRSDDELDDRRHAEVRRTPAGEH